MLRFLSYEIGAYRLLMNGIIRSVGSVLYEPCHVFAESPHCLESLLVTEHVLGTVTVYLIPILRANYIHIAYGKVFVQPVKSGCGTASSA